MTASVLSTPESCADKKVSTSAEGHKLLPMENGSNGLVDQLTSLYNDAHQKLTMLTRLFRAHGEFCAQRPWEVIICTLMVVMCVMTMSLYTTTKVCDWNYKCFEDEDIKSSDVIILTITRCLAVMYIYLQFCNLKKLGSKYLLGIAGVFTIFASFMFSIAVINLVGSDLTGLNEALPFFLLLVDLSKASALARFALSSASQDEVKGNIGRGMATLGPIITLDSVVEILVIGVGTISGVKQLETMCCFGCLSVLANYLAFMTFYPACLALVLELSRERVASQPMWQLQKLAKALQEEEEQKPNPVTQRIKIIMSAGLLLVHAHSRWIVGSEEQDPEHSDIYPRINSEMLTEYMPPKESLHWFYVKKFFSLNMDCSIAVVLAGILAVKYVFAENEVNGSEEGEDGKRSSQSSSVGDKSPLIDPISMTSSTPVPPQQTGAPKSVNKEPLPSKVETTPIPKPAVKPAVKVQKLQINSSNKAVEQDTNSVFSDSVFERSIEHQDSEDSGQGASRRQSDSSEKSPKDKENGGSKAVFFMGGEASDSEESDDAECDRVAKVRSVAMVSVETQTDTNASNRHTGPPRTLEECAAILKSDEGPVSLSDEEVLQLVYSKHIPAYKLESMLSDHERGVSVRRQLLSKSLPHNQSALRKLPYTNYDYKYVEGACCENVIGYMPIPVGYAGPLMLDDHSYQVPMATTEGCLIASTNRGCRAIASSGGCRSALLNNGMTRAPVVRLATAQRASEVKFWLEDPDNFIMVSETFNSTSRFARLNKVQVSQAARYLYIRFVSKTGDAMGMNMVSKGCERTLNWLNEEHFPDLEILSLSGNFCIDKKPSAVNWIEGRGKSVVSEAVIPSNIIKTVLKTSVPALVDLNISKNLMGSAMAGSIGGFNAHAANIVTAIYIATGQDPAQNVASSSCMTIMEPHGPNGDDLFISCTMPSIEVGTVGGGTILPPQAACLEMLGVRGACAENPGENASRLAQVVCATVMAGELSLMSALAAGHLVKSHLKHNRSQLSFANSAPSTPLTPIHEGKPELFRRMSTPAGLPGTCTFKAP